MVYVITRITVRSLRIDGVMVNASSSANDDPLSGVIRWEVDKDSISKGNLYSHSIEVGGMLWAMCVTKNYDGEYLSLFLCVKNGDYKWQYMDVTRTFKMINHEDDSKTIKHKYVEHYEKEDGNEWGCRDFSIWDYAIDEDEGFIKDNKLTLQVKFSLSNIIGFTKLHRIDFTDSNDTRNDVVLVMNGEKVYASKQYLSIHSRVFHVMFNGEFAEKDKKEIELKDVDYKEFIELLNLIYPPYKKITDDNFESLLRLGDLFEIYVVMNQCENFLINETDRTLDEKLMFSGQFRLLDLQKHCINQLESTEEVRDLQDSEFYEYYTDQIHLALYRKMMTFTD